jgi:hypothetical protein
MGHRPIFVKNGPNSFGVIDNLSCNGPFEFLNMYNLLINDPLV